MLSTMVTTKPKKTKKPPPKPRGRPPKVDGGLDHVIYIRATSELAEALASIAADRTESEGRAVTAADVAREILEAGVKREL